MGGEGEGKEHATQIDGGEGELLFGGNNMEHVVLEHSVLQYSIGLL
jgi:hypothetical protein